MGIIGRMWIALSLIYLTAILAPCPVAGSPEKAADAAPPWESEFVIWPRHAGEPTPWRSHKHLKGLSPEGFPDDVPVLFDNPDPTIQDELIWVTIIDYFKPTKEYLGMVLNSPFNLKTVKEGDNAVFQFDRKTKQLIALATDGSYRSKGVPLRAGSGALSALWEGIRQYRLGNFGHNQAAIEESINVLSSAIPQLRDVDSKNDRFLAYFVLGRCHAEAYNTDSAIEAFQSALEFKGDDVDAHMALLAEYSLKVHSPADQPKDEYSPQWESLFLEKLEYVLENFQDDLDVMGITKIIFDESQKTNLSELSEEEIARRRKFGFGTFRWKRH